MTLFKFLSRTTGTGIVAANLFTEASQGLLRGLCVLRLRRAGQLLGCQCQ